MAAPNRSFAGRMASISSMASALETWDDGDFEDSDGLLFKNSTVHSLSSRLSVRSDSNAGDEDWQVLLAPDDELSTNKAIFSAKQAGIPIPPSVPSSALLGGSIKRLGKNKPSPKIDCDDDWGNDLELPDSGMGALKLKMPLPQPPADDHDDFEDWGEGSLGIRFAGTRRDPRGGRTSSAASAMSPSLGSCMTLESEDDDLTGLVLPSEPLDFGARLDKLKRTEQSLAPALQPKPQAPTSAPVQVEPDSALLSADDVANFPDQEEPAAVLEPAPPMDPQPTPSIQMQVPGEDDDDFLTGIDFGTGDVLDTRKLTLNRNIVVKKSAAKPATPPAARPATTITFTDKPSTSRIPRPMPSTVTATRTRLTPVYESGASTHGTSRPMPTTTSAQYLRAKRSAPLLRNTNFNPTPRSSVPFLPAGGSTSQSHHVTARSSQTHLRRDSDPRRPISPSTRSYSRLSGGHQAETSGRSASKRDLAPSALARHPHPPPPKKITRPTRKRNFGDGHELDLFDDLPTSATREEKFVKAPKHTLSNKTLRSQTSATRLPMPDRNSTTTPQPQTPRSPPKVDHTPRFARDTAASRNAREQRLAGTRSRGEGPITLPQRPVSWQAQVTARSPFTSPTAQKKKGNGQKPQLIRQMTQPYSTTEKGMTYNPAMQRWEGNEDVLVSFSQPNTSTTTLALTTASTPTFAPPNHSHGRTHDRSQSMSHAVLSTIHATQRAVPPRAIKLPPTQSPVPSPPRPALISQISAPRGVQYEGRMVFDPVKMTWLKAPRHSTDPRSPMSVDMDDEEDPFAGLEDLKDNESMAGGANHPGVGGVDLHTDDPAFVGEEFDVGPGFIRRQRDEEAIWRRRVEGWVGGIRDSGEQPGGWRWSIRELAAHATAETLAT